MPRRDRDLTQLRRLAADPELTSAQVYPDELRYLLAAVDEREALRRTLALARRGPPRIGADGWRRGGIGGGCGTRGGEGA